MHIFESESAGWLFWYFCGSYLVVVSICCRTSMTQTGLGPCKMFPVEGRSSQPDVLWSHFLRLKEMGRGERGRWSGDARMR